MLSPLDRYKTIEVVLCRLWSCFMELWTNVLWVRMVTRALEVKGHCTSEYRGKEEDTEKV